jgi:hypothetical protein
VISRLASSSRCDCRCGRIAVSMVDNDGSAPTSRRRHVVRLAVFAGFLLGMFYLVAVARVIDVAQVRRVILATGPAAPLTYVVVSAVLGALFVPGAILAAGSGILFGPVLGIFVTLGATVGTAIVASRLGRRAGRDSARALLGTKRADRATRTMGGSSASDSSPAFRMRSPPMRSGRSEFRCGRWPSVRSSVRRRGHSCTPRWAPRSGICRRRWHTRR